ncbi:MAG: Guanylate kinase [candidate division WS2 bacterium]|nr:Guanylate kinase [Candidatus Lithacetigena glycinireducens]
MNPEFTTPFDYKPMLIIISGPSGVGKGVIIKEVLQKDCKLAFSVSITTRQRRKNEVEGKDYSFLSREDFQKKIENNDFLEWAIVHGNYYGTLKSKVQDLFNSKYDVLLDVDVQGAEKIKLLIPDSVSIFLLPPSLAELETRLKLRGTDDEFEINKRLSRAKEELSYLRNYDYWIINTTPDETVSFICKIINVERHKIHRLKGEIFHE